VDVTVEDAGPCRKLLAISVPAKEVAARIEEEYERLRTTVLVDGFRKGHVPRKLLERRFGEQVVEDVKTSLMSSTTNEAMGQKELKSLGEPSFDDVKYEPDQDLEFKATVDVEPAFELGEYRGLKLVRRSPQVTDEDLDKGLRNVAMRLARFEPVQDGSVEAADMVLCDWEARTGDEAVANETDDDVHVAGRRFADWGVKDLPQLLVGARAGERREAEIQFPDNYPVEKYRGKEGRLAVTIKEIRRPVVPTLTDELARSLDYDSLDDLKSAVRSRMEAEKRAHVEEDLETQARDQLVATVKFDLPENLVKRQARDVFSRTQLRLRYRGVPPEEIREHLDDLRLASEEAAERASKLYFILDRIAQKEKLYVTENEVTNRIAVLANANNVSTDKLRQDLEREGRLGELRGAMREEKTMEFLLEHAEIEDEAHEPG